MTMLQRLLALSALLVLGACSGGGSDEGSSPFGGGDGGTDSTTSPTLVVTLSNNTISSANPATVTVVLKDASGAALPDAVITLSTLSGNLARFDSNTILTNAQGQAGTILRSSAGGVQAADQVIGVATVGSKQVQGKAGFTISAEAPSLSASISSSTISATAPATLRVLARDLAGALLPGAVVTFSSQSGLATFSPPSQVTADTGNIGEATTVVSPKSAASTGADTLVASLTVQGITTTAPVVVQFISSTPTGTPTLDLALSSTSISAAAPATVTATLRDAQGQGVASQVVSFTVLRGLAVTNIGTALTNAAGQAVVLLSPASAALAGADEVSARVTYAGTALQRTQGFQVQATAVTLDSFAASANPLSAYGQTDLSLGVTGASVTAPVNITVSSACMNLGKATVSPAAFTATSNSVTLQYRDNGCGGVQTTDQLQAVVTATGASRSLTLKLTSPAESSIAFVQAAPEQIYLRGSGFTESSVVTFEVRDAAGNPLPNRVVELRLQTGAGNVTMEGRGVESVNPPSGNPFTLTSNAIGRVSARVNSGTLPTPVRVHARLATNPDIATVSSNLSVAVGLPSQLNFSLSQTTRNIEGYDIDGTPNTYQIIASDRSGNPVPAGTSINFVTEGGQIEAIKQTQLVSGISRTSAAFVSASPRPRDGRVTITAYALGEESFLDLNGNNHYDADEPFQDLGNVFKDRKFDGVYVNSEDEFIPLNINNGSACVVTSNPLLALDASIPSGPDTCDGAWSGAGQVYVRRAVETVLSTSVARPLWANIGGLSDSCTANVVALQTGPEPTQTTNFVAVGGDTWYGGTTGTLTFIAADRNPTRLNPMAAGTVVSATTPTVGLTVTVGGGTPVPSTTEASLASVAYTFTDPATVTKGVIFVGFRSPSGLLSTFSVDVELNGRPSACTLP